MSKPQTSQSRGRNSHQYRGRSRGGPRRPFRGRAQHSHHPAQDKQNIQQSPNSNQFFDWWDEEFKPVESDEIQHRSASRSSLSFSQSSQEQFHRQRGNQNYGYHQKDSGGSYQYTNSGKPSRYSKFHQLIRLSNMDGNNIVTEISDNPDFNLLLNSDMNNDFLVITLRILAKLEEANFTRIVINILSDLCKSKFFENLELYLFKLAPTTQDNVRANKLYWEDVTRFWNNLHDFFKIIIYLVPIQAYNRLLPILESTLYVVQSLKTKADHNLHIDVPPRIEKLHTQLKKKNKEYASGAAYQMSPDFRNLNIVPTVEDLNDHHPYIRPCKVDGAYDSVDHYLDVQFRLLREDFICPLRAGIEEYKRSAGTNVRMTQTSDIRIFEKVKLISPTIVKNKIGITINFGRLPKINWSHSKLFMYGSLLCLTNDNFKSVLFVTVADRDAQLLQKGKLIIEPCVGTQITLDMYNSEYVMVESKVYFLPYYHTLSSLRYISEEDFPMKRYIVDAKSDPVPPKYLNKSTVYVYKRLNIPVMHVTRWPSARHLLLDESQYEAYKSALLQELSVLHGPPGTGKTFMALQIASTLLANSSSWYNPANPTPMIVVCLTNHALDQFLEGILQYTTSLVRIGEQSKHQSLAQYKLKAVRDNYFKDEKKKHRAWQRMTYYQREMKKVLLGLEKCYSVITTLTSNTCIVSPNVFRQYCNDHELSGLTPKDLLTSLFGAQNASLALGINTIASDSAQTAVDEAKDSDDENIDADDDLDIGSVVHTNDSEFTCLEMNYLDGAIQKYDTELRTSQRGGNHLQSNHCAATIGKFRQLQALKTALQEELSHHPLLANRSVSGNPLKDKNWGIYYHWLTSSYEVVKEQIAQMEEELQKISSLLNDFKQITDLEVMRNSLVVGLTTTGAARLHESLRALRAPIVLVEEAAEILEAHVICSLTKHCQQVILIGDHKQLRPKPATYHLEIHYNLSISLFERIVKMRNKCTQLVIQHRMRPEIAKLLTPSIYERLENHSSVLTYPNVKGLKKNLFFINHQNQEAGSSSNESMSNPFEVKFLLASAIYLLQQGYQPDEVTILCTYSGQLFKFKEAKKSMPTLRNVRVTTVDNYQGEENRIILLSLVRNNRSGNIGFLRIQNRVCVALSRARQGLYIMGNMNNLLMNNEIWPKIKESLDTNDAIGDCLVLQCQVHTDQYTEIRHASDFKNSPNGGCLRRCAATLSCGHTCQKPCHIVNRDHKDYICKETCLNRCPNGHRCKLLCQKPCKPCQEIVMVDLRCHHTVSLPCSTDLKEYQCIIEVTTLLRCGHTVQKPCHRESSIFPCTNFCKKLLACGHSCTRPCHIDDDPFHIRYMCQKNCTKIAVGCLHSHRCPKKCHEQCNLCKVIIQKERSCGHIIPSLCSMDVEKETCELPCKCILSCGHTCGKKCNLPCGLCTEMIDKIVPECGHQVRIACHKIPTAADCKGQCPRTLKCGHPCTTQCCEPCTEQCQYPRPLPKPVLCQHVYPVPCYKIEAGLSEYADKLLQHCPAPCATPLPCGHMCSGNCGSCKQGRIHQLCRKKCNKILICGHKCESLCDLECEPCQKACDLRCGHNKCKNQCGAPCTPCQEPCSQQCIHFKCDKKCFEICDKDFCDAPCPEQLPCGHSCIGFCGEPCPPLCRICNEKELSIFITDKSQSERRFVFLPECSHCIESSYLDWQWKKSYRIGIKVCPVCQIRITRCTRYTNQIKKECKNIEIVKQEVFMRRSILRFDKNGIITDINKLEQDYAMHFPDSKVQKKLFESLRTHINQWGGNTIELVKDLSSKMRIIEIVLKKLKEIPHFDRSFDDWPVVLNQIIMIMTSLPTTQIISNQMIDDIKDELCRLHYMIQLCKFGSNQILSTKKAALQVKIIYLGLLNLRKFTNSQSEAMCKQLLNLKNSLKLSCSIDEWKQIDIKLTGVDEADWCKCSNGHIYAGQCAQCPSAPTE